MNYGFRNTSGFTTFELIVVIGLAAVMVFVSVPIYSSLQRSSVLKDSSTQLVQTIRLAQDRSKTGWNDSLHGVFLDTDPPSGPDRFILYQGTSYVLRDTSFDLIVALDDSELISGLTGTPDVNDINFTHAEGRPSLTGTISLVHADETILIDINSVGRITVQSP